MDGRRPFGKGQMKALPLLSFDLISCYSALFFSPIATAMPLKNALTSQKFLSKDGRSAGLPFGLAMRRGGPQGQTKAAEPPQGRADLRAPKRSACRRQEAPKKYPPSEDADEGWKMLKGLVYFTSRRIPWECEENSGAYMHWMLLIPLLKSPFWATRTGYSKT